MKYIKFFENFNFGFNITIENPKGTYKSFDSDDYPLKGVTYPVDYGSISGYVGEDGNDLDIFVGSGSIYGYIVVWRLDVPTETKMFMNLTKKELSEIKDQFGPVLVKCKTLSKNEFLKKCEQFRIP